MGDKVSNALRWIKGVLESQGVDYQVVGGLAANMHGGTRPVADIDMYIARSGADKLMPSAQPFVSKPLVHCIEGAWNLEYCQLIYQEQKIEIGLSPGTTLFDKQRGEWVELVTDYAASVQRSYGGVEVPVIPVADLLAYKALLNREVDRIDIAELRRLPPARRTAHQVAAAEW